MSIKSTLPEEIEPGSGHYSFRADLRVNGWLWLAVASSAIGELVLLPRFPEWSAVWRAVVAMVPVLASLLWARRLLTWMRGMDELQRRITTAASVFACAATLFVMATLHVLKVANVIPMTFQPGAGFVLIWLVVCFYLLGRNVFGRRYQ